MTSPERAEEPRKGPVGFEDDNGPLLEAEGGPEYEGDPDFPEPMFNDPDFGIVDPWRCFESIMIAGEVSDSEWASWKQRWKEPRDPEWSAAEVAHIRLDASEDIGQHMRDIWAILLPEDPG